jgi:excisionase family DNA binding protein
MMTIAEIAAEAKVDPVTPRRWIAKGRLRAVRVGPRAIRVERAEFERFISEQVGTAEPGSSTRQDCAT